MTYDGFHGHFSAEGYSKYYPSLVYGYEQALEHIEELKNVNGDHHFSKAKWQIEIITEVVTIINL